MMICRCGNSKCRNCRVALEIELLAKRLEEQDINGLAAPWRQRHYAAQLRVIAVSMETELEGNQVYKSFN